MRRSEFEVTDPKAIESVLSECEYGVLSLVSRGEPYGVAVNFAYREGVVYFHGSIEGRKVEAIGDRAKVAFLVVKPYAYIPSYFSDTSAAYPATQFFTSVHISGEAIRVSDEREKAFGLTALMEKMQPEGKYDPIDAANPIYTKMMELTGVYKIVPNVMTLKVKAGQNLPKERYDTLLKHIEERNGSVDSATLQLMHSVRS
ncbi:MAG: pyridoxamine 5'-phosphate oxidase family protein [Sulfuricurvum sp.]|uniref:pyridoxamine 5'-phosphate oxidase family protein n=1 Tax=Sulfuricurvum sp. TaxID=2025608 RepID=UPI00261EF76D|nr:pyridoxamine 5'-phosphate oxidase family protein [Sulfuricurvum sp.]MDD5117839.1 pyridoxamine 5'-phosphate oxidase family protein [Sulfuricurvum sp.]